MYLIQNILEPAIKGYGRLRVKSPIGTAARKRNIPLKTASYWLSSDGGPLQTTGLMQAL